ncbi:MAG TPA: hypothetical protein VF049_18710 [Nocardioidaceae bacterium]|jgi:hypothetical protein
MGRQVRQPRGPAGLGRLPESHWKQWYDVRPVARTDLRIDQVVVGPSGLYVIGRPGQQPRPRPEVDHPGGHVLLPLLETREAADAVASLLPGRYRATLRPVVCLGEDHPLAETVSGVLVTSGATLGHILRASPLVLSTSEVTEVAGFLGRRLEPVPVVPTARPRRRLRRRLVMAAAATATVAALSPGIVQLVRGG